MTDHLVPIKLRVKPDNRYFHDAYCVELTMPASRIKVRSPHFLLAQSEPKPSERKMLLAIAGATEMALHELAVRERRRFKKAESGITKMRSKLCQKNVQ